MNDGRSTIDVSVVVPVYSGQDYLERLVAELEAVRADWVAQGAPMRLSEVILVDDSAIDGSPALIDRLAAMHNWVVPLHLSRNFGQHPATVAGILYCAGDWVVTMDEDLQHPPDKIIALLRAAVAESSDVVYAQPIKGVHKSHVRDLGSVFIKRLIAWLTGSQHVRQINSFRLIRGDVARSVASVVIHDTYFDIELGFFTQRIVGLPMALVDERFLRTGQSGYKLRSLISHAWRMIFSAHLRVLRFFTVAGALTIALSAVFAAILIIGNLIWPTFVAVRGWSSIMVTTMFFAGVNIALAGIALQYLSTLVLRAHGRPTFFVIDRSSDKALAAFLSGGAREGS